MGNSLEEYLKNCTLPGFLGNKKEQEKLKKEKEDEERKKIIVKDKIFLKREIPPGF